MGDICPLLPAPHVECHLAGEQHLAANLAGGGGALHLTALSGHGGLVDSARQHLVTTGSSV
jgi:hypothetical protein